MKKEVEPSIYRPISEHQVLMRIRQVREPMLSDGLTVMSAPIERSLL